MLVLTLFNFSGCAPLHWGCLSKRTCKLRPCETTGLPLLKPKQSIRHMVFTRQFLLLAASFTANMLAFSAVSIHLIPMLSERGFSMSDAVWLAAIVGPMQVLGRIGEYTIGARFRATQVAMFACIILPI